jgi:hypothetical protein
MFKFFPDSYRCSFPRSAWECILDALRPVFRTSETEVQGTQSVPDAFPRRAWERVPALVCKKNLNIEFYFILFIFFSVILVQKQK